MNGSELTLASWNVNSLRARQEHVRRFLVEYRPDVLCLQETKVSDEQLPGELFAELGYHVAHSGQKTYNGVLIAALEEPAEVSRGLSGEDSEEQKRLIAATVGGIRVINVYVPNGGEVGSDKFAEKLTFLAGLRDYLARRHTPGEALVVTGDFNVAPEPRDVWDAEALDGTTCYHPDEREALGHVAEWGLEDVFRRFHTEAGLYTWWDYRQGAFQRDRGMRIDHIWATHPLAGRAGACWAEREERGRDKASDHVPLLATFAAAAE